MNPYNIHYERTALTNYATVLFNIVADISAALILVSIIHFQNKTDNEGQNRRCEGGAALILRD